MSDPVQFLTAKLAKVEKQARGQWTEKDDIRCPNCTPNHVSGWKSRQAMRDRTVFTLEPCGCQVSRGVVMERTPDEEKLRLVAATRTVLELHPLYNGTCDTCLAEIEPYVEAIHMEPYPCLTIKALAAGWGWIDE